MGGQALSPSPRRPDPEHQALIDDAVALFTLRYGRTISKEEARQVTERMTAFFALLNEGHIGGKKV